jgi:hypothetical protein
VVSRCEILDIGDKRQNIGSCCWIQASGSPTHEMSATQSGKHKPG